MFCFFFPGDVGDIYFLRPRAFTTEKSYNELKGTARFPEWYQGRKLAPRAFSWDRLPYSPFFKNPFPNHDTVAWQVSESNHKTPLVLRMNCADCCLMLLQPFFSPNLMADYHLQGCFAAKDLPTDLIYSKEEVEELGKKSKAE